MKSAGIFIRMCLFLHNHSRGVKSRFWMFIAYMPFITASILDLDLGLDATLFQHRMSPSVSYNQNCTFASNICFLALERLISFDTFISIFVQLCS